jgi:hypothetical protein
MGAGIVNVVALVLGAGLGAGFMAIVHEVCRWDAERRRLNAALAAVAAEPAPALLAPEAPEAPDVAPGRHRRGEDTDILDMRARSFAAGLAARDTGPVSTDPADHGWQRPSTMIPDAGPPAEFIARHPGSRDHRTLAEQAGDLAAVPYIPVPVMLPEVPVLPVWDGSGQKIGTTA